MRSIRMLASLVCLMLFNFQIQATNLPFQNLDSGAMGQIVGDMSANFLHTSVSGANTLGHVFGFEVGVVGGQTSTPHLNSVVNSQPGISADASDLPEAELLGVLTVPLGITAEIGLVPKVGSSDFKFNSYSAAVKWTATELFFSDLPLSLATKLSYTSASVEADETIQSVPSVLKYNNAETAFTLLASKNLAILEPYIGVGYLMATGTLNASGSTTVFAPSYSTSGSASASRSGTFWMVGTEVKLLVVKLGAEYTNALGTNRIMGKLSVYF